MPTSWHIVSVSSARGLRFAAVLLPALAGQSASGTIGKGHDAAIGAYTGTGRACYGKLTITPKYISWITPFSKCKRSSYSILKDENGVDGLRVAYVLDKQGGQCRYRVLIMTHDAPSDPRIGWNVVGYKSLRSYREQRAEDGLSCYLVR